MDLDNSTGFASLDPGDMARHIAALPDQCEAAWRQVAGLDLPAALGDVDQVVILGMGGSAIGGALVQGLLSGECKVPIHVVRDYELPAYAHGPRCLAVACSYSGNTEETLWAADEALGRGIRIAVLTTGGRLAAWAEEHRLALVRFEYASQPRAALGYSFTLLLGMLWRLGLARDYSDDLAEALAHSREWQREIAPAVPLAHNAAKMLAQGLRDRLPVIYGAGHLASVANRWKTQLNENAKHWAFWEALPELHHNSVVGFDLPVSVRERVTVIMLRSSLDHPRVQRRWEVTEQLLHREGIAFQTLWARGDSRLAQMLTLVHFGDYVSFYLAMANNADPTPIGAIAFLKERLQQAA